MKRISAYKFTGENDIKFSPKEYSKFKFGSIFFANKFGKELFDSFISSDYFDEIIKFLKENENSNIIVYSSPYSHIVTATYALKDSFINYLNIKLNELGLNSVIESKIYRNNTYSQDYGELSKEERYSLIKETKFYTDINWIGGNICLFLDDIVITGTHEKVIEQMLIKFGINDFSNLYFLYFAELINPEQCSPTIENYLNYAYVKSYDDIIHLILLNDFVLNTRVTKYLLNSSEKDFIKFITIVNKFNDKFLLTLYNSALANSYNKISQYKNNFDILTKKVNI